jgi:serine/threonine-protein kinase
MLRDLARIRGALSTMPVTVNEAEPATGAGTVVAPAAASVAHGNGDFDGRANAVATTALVPRNWLLACRNTVANLQLGRASLAALVVLGLLAGLASGYFTRSEDLISERNASASTAAATLPALWMAPHWELIPRQGSAEEQYHYAQLRAADADQEAAWIAVSGYFPSARGWASQAYIQLARVLLRRHDAERLRVFATEIDRWNAAQTREHEKELVTIIQAAAKAVDGDQEGTISELEKLHLSSTIDAALLELALEVTIQGTHSASRPGTSQSMPPGLRNIQVRLFNQLSSVENSEQLGRRQSG